MVCSPEQIRPAEWFELIWLSEDPLFDDMADARSFYRLLLELYQHIAEAARQERYRPGAEGGALTREALADWCDGFLTGHQYLEDIWQVALDDLDDEQLFDAVGAALDWAVACAEGDLGAWNRDESDTALGGAQLELLQLLASYHAVHRHWRSSGRRGDVGQLFEQMQPVTADEQCPCGSGRPFRHCCLH
jgi:uncharacterized protein